MIKITKNKINQAKHRKNIILKNKIMKSKQQTIREKKQQNCKS